MHKASVDIIESERHISTNLVVLLLIIISTYSIAINTLYFYGFASSDDNRYLMAGINWATGRSFLSLDMHDLYYSTAARLGMTFTTGLLYKIAGGRLLLVAYCFLLFHAVIILLAYVLGRILHNIVTGLIAAFLVAFSPSILSISGLVAPDLPQTIFFLASLIFIVLMGRYKDGGIKHESYRMAFSFLAGILIGIAYSYKMSAVVMAASGGLSILWSFRHSPKKNLTVSLLFYCLGFLTIFAISAYIVHHYGGQRYFENNFIGVAPLARKGPIDQLRLFYISSKDIIPISLWWLLLGATIYSCSKFSNATIVLNFWFILLYFIVGSLHLNQYYPLPIQNRYFIPVFCLGFIMSARCCWELICLLRVKYARKIGDIFIACVVFIIIAITGLEVKLFFPHADDAISSRRLLARSFLEALYLADNQYCEYPIVLCSDLSDRMSALVFKRTKGQVKNDQRVIYLNNYYLNDFRDALPKAPFLYFATNNKSESSNYEFDPCLLDSNAFRVKFIKLVFPISPLKDIAYAGNLLHGFNADPPYRATTRPVYIYLVEPLGN